MHDSITSVIRMCYNKKISSHHAGIESVSVVVKKGERDRVSKKNQIEIFLKKGEERNNQDAFAAYFFIDHAHVFRIKEILC